MEAVRVAHEVDVDQLMRLAEEARAVARVSRGGEMYLLREARRPPLEPMLRDAVADGDQLVLVGTLDDVPVGYALIRLERLPDRSTMAMVDEIYVEPAGRQVGIGEGLVTAVLAWAGERQCRGVGATALPGDRDTKNLFERFGLVARAIVVYRALSEGSIEP
ncbi:MAG: acetyltransferase family protein [Acidimicrobiia bacterium]|nr:acetyltransferase family protein [Acidimicrobiia bacterium]